MTEDAHIAAHLTTVADVLHELASEIEELGTSLCMDPAIIAHHMGTLQSIDLIAQKQRWLATLLKADCPLSAVNTIGVEALKARFASPNAH
jgi:hypothetical protein